MITSENTSIPPPSYPDIIKYFRNPSRLNKDISREMIQNIFNDDIQDFLGNGNENHRSLVENMYSMALDPGLMRKHEFNGMVEEGVTMLNRQALLYELRNRVNFREEDDGSKYNVDRQLKILKIDLESFRKADELGAGDFNLNIFGKRLNEMIVEIAIDLEIDPNNLIAGRYGGDEFCIGVINDQKGRVFDQIEELKASILKKVSNVRGYFSDSNETDKFSLKNNEVEEISIPGDEDKSGRLIYLSFLQRGLVLDAKQIEREKKYFENSPIVSLTEYLKDGLAKNIYPRFIEKMADKEDQILAKVNYLIKIHPELQIPFFLAQTLDEKNPSDKNKRTGKMLNFIENYLIDPLLDEVVMSRFDIIDHIESGEFARIFTYEIKLKEINDNLSYVYGDEVLIDFWKKHLLKDKKLQKAIEEGKVKIGRVGGAIMIAEVKKQDGSGSLSAVEIKQLKSIGHTELGYENNVIKHEVGFSEVLIPKEEIIEEKAKEIFSKCLIESSNNWLDKTFIRLFDDNNKKKFDQFLSLIINLEDHDGGIEDKATLLSAKYFTGKRWDRRIASALERLILVQDSSTVEKKDKVIKAFNKLKLKKLEQEKII